jgi:hypothetical protein
LPVHKELSYAVIKQRWRDECADLKPRIDIYKDPQALKFMQNANTAHDDLKSLTFVTFSWGQQAATDYSHAHSDAQ